MNTSAPTNTACVNIPISDLFGCEAAAMSPEQTLIARLPGDNGRFVRVLRDEALDGLTVVIGIDTLLPVSFQVDARIMETMIGHFPVADAAAVPAETIIGSVAADNGRWIHLLRDRANGCIVGVAGMDTAHALRFHIDRQAMMAMAAAFPGKWANRFKAEGTAH